MSERLEEATLGALAQILDRLGDIRDSIERPREYGSVGSPVKLTWAAGATDEFVNDGSFAGVGIFNLSASTIRVAFTPNGARAAETSLFTLSARGFLILPYRGATVSVGGASLGEAVIVPFTVPQPANAGTF